MSKGLSLWTPDGPISVDPRFVDRRTWPRQPSSTTLRKYGLTVDDWQAIAERQGLVCAVCKTLPASGRLHIDHEHVRGFKKLPPQERKKHVRGLVCYLANHFWLARQMDTAKARNLADYLERYEARRAANDNGR